METDFLRTLRRTVLIAACAAAPLQAADPFATLEAVPPLHGLQASACRPADPDRVLDLAAVVDRALCHNPQTRQAWAEARLQAAQLGVAQAAYLPSISAEADLMRLRNEAVRGNSPYTQRSVEASLAWVLFDFGARAATLENARQLYAAAVFSREATVQAVFLAAVQAYFQQHAAKAALEAAQLAEKAALESLNAADARYAAGSATPADRLQARTAHAQAVLNRIAAEGALKSAQGALARVLGIEPLRPLALAPLPPAVPDARFEADIGRLIEQARARRPDLAAAEAQYRAARANIEAARSAHLPTLSFGIVGASSQIMHEPAYDSASLGLTLRIPLFSGFATSYRVHAATAQAEAQAARRDQLQQQVALDVWNAHAALTTATQSVKTAHELLESAIQSERVAAGRYRAGVGNILDLINAQAALASARLSRIQAETNWYISRTVLAQALGALDASLLASLFAAAPAPKPPAKQPGTDKP